VAGAEVKYLINFGPISEPFPVHPGKSDSQEANLRGTDSENTHPSNIVVGPSRLGIRFAKTFRPSGRIQKRHLLPIGRLGRIRDCQVPYWLQFTERPVSIN
jgi:hypothetical protein